LAELLADFLDKEFKAAPELIGRGILPVGGKLVLGGAPKSNKSYIALNMAVALALGRPLFGGYYSSNLPVFPVRKKCRVLYIEQEIGEQGLQERLAKLAVGLDLLGVDFYIKSRDMGMRMDTEDGRKLIGAEIGQVRPDVTFLDPLAKFHLSDENSAQHMGAIMRVGDHWIEDYGTALVYIHHTGHQHPDNPRRGGDKLRGSSAVFADADSIILCERESAASTKEPLVKLEFEIRRGAPLEDAYVRRLIDGKVIYIPTGERFKERPSVAVREKDQYAKL
jgi:RecA-family ATPase